MKAATLARLLFVVAVYLKVGAVALDVSTESNTHSRSLLAACRTVPYGQCGGKGNGGRSAGVWCTCPSGFRCKHFNKDWYSCQKGKTPATKKKTPPKASSLAGCRAGAYAQCGGKGSGGKNAGVWCGCQSGYYCKQYNSDWYSCQPGKAPVTKKTPPKKATSTTKAPSKNRRTGSTISRRAMSDYSNPSWPQGTYPQCKDVEWRPTQYSHWCTMPPVAGQCPAGVKGKFGRMTVYNGPVIGHKGYCDWNLEGSATYASVAISSKYLKKFGGSPCGKCMCVQIQGVDEHSMYGQDPSDVLRKHKGKTFLARVSDQCAECEDEHIDMLMDKPFCDALLDGSNPMGAEARRRRAAVPAVMPVEDAARIGVWKSCWMWAPDGCNTDCSKYM